MADNGRTTQFKEKSGISTLNKRANLEGNKIEQEECCLQDSKEGQALEEM